MKSNKRYVVYLEQQDGTYRGIYSSSKRERCVKYIRSYGESRYKMKIEIEPVRYKHHGYDYDFD